LLRHRTADDLVLEHEAGGRRQRLGQDLDAGELAGAAALLLVRIVDGDLPRDRLAIGDLWGLRMNVIRHRSIPNLQRLRFLVRLSAGLGALPVWPPAHHRMVKRRLWRVLVVDREGSAAT
jgi:hypothetical protein